MENIAPSQNNFLIGQENAEKVFLNAWKKGALHHAWLISGEEGVGKATLCYKIARFLLSADENNKGQYQNLNISENDQAFRLIARGAHPDLKVLERDFIETDKKKILKALKDGNALNDDELQRLKKSAFIKVDEARTVNAFLSKKSFEGNWRVVIIDSADDLNNAGANAILKILEEPPLKSVLLLVSQQPNRLLPTIRSRCAKLALQPLSEQQVATLMHRYRPELSEKNVQGIAKISGGSIGRALRYADADGLSVYQSLQKLIYAGTHFDVAETFALAAAASKDEAVWDLTVELFQTLIFENMQSGAHIQALGKVWDMTQQMFHDTDVLNMDKKQVLINLIHAMNKAVQDVD